MTRTPRVLLTVGTDSTRDAGAGPRRDYAVIAAALDATILDTRNVHRSPIGRVIRAVFGLAAAQAWLAFRRRHLYDVVVTDGEHVGIPLSALLRLTRSGVRHVMIGHRLSTPKKRPFFRLLRVHERMDLIAVHARRQREFAVVDLRVEPSRLALIPYQVDTEFWSPQAAAEERLVVSAGLEHRDYATLFRAADGLDARVVIGASSYWSRHLVTNAAKPSNVRIGSFDYVALRDLYARAAVVVVPLADVDNQAGVTTILEAMAMGKPVVVTQSLGQTDVVQDRRVTARPGLRPRPAGFAMILAEQAGLRLEPNGFYVPPGDSDALHRAIAYLLDHPDERARLGGAGRRLAMELFTVEQFAERIRALVLATLRPEPEISIVRRAS